jgi:hypothetical protein
MPCEIGADCREDEGYVCSTIQEEWGLESPPILVCIVEMT